MSLNDCGQGDRESSEDILEKNTVITKSND